MEDRWEYRPLAEQEAKAPPDEPAAPRLRRWLLIAGLLLCAAVIGLVIVRPFRGAARTRPAERGAPEEAAREVPSRPPDREDPSLFPPQTPVPETCDELEEEALAVGVRIRERYPNTLEALNLLAWMHHSLGNSLEAAQCFREWLERHPDSAQAYFRLGYYAKGQGSDAEAVEYFQEAFKRDPTLPDLQVSLGECLMNSGKLEEALAVLEGDIGRSAANANRFFVRGHVYLRMQRYEEAKRAFGRAGEIDPTFTPAHYGLATACAKLGQTEEAKKHLDDFQKRKAADVARRLDPPADDLASRRRMVAVWYNEAGRIYQGKGDVQQAEVHWLRAASIDSADTESRRALVSLYSLEGKIEQAARVSAELSGIVSRQGN